MGSFSIVGFLICIAIVFMILKAGDNHAVKTEGANKETNIKLVWVAVIACLALLGLMVVIGN